MSDVGQHTSNRGEDSSKTDNGVQGCIKFDQVNLPPMRIHRENLLTSYHLRKLGGGDSPPYYRTNRPSYCG